MLPVTPRRMHLILFCSPAKNNLPSHPVYTHAGLKSSRNSPRKPAYAINLSILVVLSQLCMPVSFGNTRSKRITQFFFIYFALRTSEWQIRQILYMLPVKLVFVTSYLAALRHLPIIPPCFRRHDYLVAKSKNLSLFPPKLAFSPSFDTFVLLQLCKLGGHASKTSMLSELPIKSPSSAPFDHPLSG